MICNPLVAYTSFLVGLIERISQLTHVVSYDDYLRRIRKMHLKTQDMLKATRSDPEMYLPLVHIRPANHPMYSLVLFHDCDNMIIQFIHSGPCTHYLGDVISSKIDNKVVPFHKFKKILNWSPLVRSHILFGWFIHADEGEKILCMNCI